MSAWRSRTLRTAARVAFVALAAGACSDSGIPADPNPTPPQACLIAQTGCAGRVRMGTGAFVPIYRTHDLTEVHAGLTRAVISIHGADRNPDDYFERMVAAVQEAEQVDRTVVIAPHFQASDDGPQVDELYWSSSGWKKGHLSSSDGPSGRASSYAVLDELVRLLSDRSRFPDLQEVVVAGHSAGGQVVHRYAAGGEPSVAGLGIRYVVTNPSTYLYLGPERAAGDDFHVPMEEACPDYQEWHYGPMGLNSYMSRLAAGVMESNLVGRDVTILIGSDDTGTANLDMTCGAMLQGPNRFERGKTLVRYMAWAYPQARHTRVVVPGVGHSSRDMWLSAEGRAVLFP